MPGQEHDWVQLRLSHEEEMMTYCTPQGCEKGEHATHAHGEQWTFEENVARNRCTFVGGGGASEQGEVQGDHLGI